MANKTKSTALEFERGQVVNADTGVTYFGEAGVDEYRYPDHRALLRNGNASPVRCVKRRCVFRCPVCGDLFTARLDSVRSGRRKACGCLGRGRAYIKNAAALAAN